MELLDQAVYRLDIGDYYSVISFGKSDFVFGFSQNSEKLLSETFRFVSVMRRVNPGIYRVRVYQRSYLSLDIPSVLVADQAVLEKEGSRA